MEINPCTHQDKPRLHPDVDPKEAMVLNVAVLGSPNAGKSVLTNSLVGANVCVVSNKVHTTRESTTAVTVDGNTQLIIADNPGVIDSEHKNKHKLELSLLKDPETSIERSDMLAVVVDATNKLTQQGRLDPKVMHLLHRYIDKPSVLVVNKIDLVKGKTSLLDVTYLLARGTVDGKAMQRKLSKLMQNNPAMTSKNNKTDMDVRDQERIASLVAKPLHEVLPGQLRRAFDNQIGWPHFDRIFMMSALHGDGVSELHDYLVTQSRRGKWSFHSSVVTDQDPVQLVLSVIRGRLLEHLYWDIPYNLKLKIGVWDVNEHDVFRVRVDIVAQTKLIAKRVIGVRGGTIKQVSNESIQELRNLFQRDIHLKLGVESIRG